MSLKEATSTQTFLGSKHKVFLVILLFSFILYGGTLKNKYALDDEFVTYNNEQVHKGVRAIPEIFTSRYANNNEKENYEYRPIVKASFAIEYQLFKESPGISHLINILLYAFVCFLSFRVLVSLFPKIDPIVFASVTLLFLFHPIHTEVVASLKNRDVLFSFMGCLLALRSSIKWCDLKKNVYLLYSFFWLAFALISKLDSLPFIAIIPFSLYFTKRISGLKLATFFIGMFLVLVFVKLGSKLILKSNPTKRVFLYFENPLYLHHAIDDRLRAFFSSLFFYVRLHVLPHPLVCYYGYNEWPIGSWSFYGIWVSMLILAIGIYLFFKYKNDRFNIHWFGVAYFIISISMFLNLVKPAVGIVAERFAFIASWGFCIFIIACIIKIKGLNERKISVRYSNVLMVFIGILLLMGARVMARNADWKDQFTLYKNDVKVADKSAKLHALYAAKCAQAVNDASLPMTERQQLLNEAVEHYKMSIEIFPEYATSFNNLGMLYHSYFKDYSTGRKYLLEAIKINTVYSQAYFNLALCEYELKNYDTCIKHLLTAIRLKPTFNQAHLNLTTILIKTGQIDKAEEINKLLEKKYPGNATILFNRGAVSLARMDTVSAVKYFEKSIEIQPNNPQLSNYLQEYFNSHRNFDKASYYQNIGQNSSMRAN